MVIQIQVRGLERVNRFLAELPNQLNNEILKKSDEFMRFIQKSAKLRAPKDTRELANSISVRRTGNDVILTVDSPYGIFQEEGFTQHWIHTDQIVGSNKFNQIYGEKRGFIFVRKFTPFVKPALESGLKNLPNLMTNAIKNAINKSRKGGM